MSREETSTEARLQIDSLDETLRVARDLCAATGAFFATSTGHVRLTPLEHVPAQDVVQRAEALARICLTDPAVGRRALFVKAETRTEEQRPERSLICAALPVWSDELSFGVLGVIDTTPLELDDQQREELVALAKSLARQLIAGAIFEHPDREPVASASLERFLGEVLNPLTDPTQMLDSPLEDLLEGLDEGILCCDSEGLVLYANRAARLLHGLKEGQPFTGRHLTSAAALRTGAGKPLQAEDHPLLQAARDGVPRAADLILPGSDEESAVHLSVSAKPVAIGERMGAIAVVRDVTADWIEKQQLAHYALHDPLTGLANRYLLIEELQRMLRGLDRRGGSVSLVFMDIDDFKQINDEHGHAVGDAVLKTVGHRLEAAVRSQDVVTRLGGDEFVVAHVSTPDVADGDRIVARVRKVLSAPYLVGGGVLEVNVSIGWVRTSSIDTTPQELLEQADKAMYNHKRRRSAEATER